MLRELVGFEVWFLVEFEVGFSKLKTTQLSAFAPALHLCPLFWDFLCAIIRKITAQTLERFPQQEKLEIGQKMSKNFKNSTKFILHDE